MNRRVHIAERPLVGGQLTVRVHIPLAHQQDELALGKLGVNFRQRHAMKGKVPCCEPWVFPFVRHGNHIGVVQMLPVTVTTMFALWRRWWLGGIAL